MKKVFLILLVSLFLSLFSVFFLEPSKAQSAQDPTALFSLVGTEKSVRRDNIKAPISIAEVRQQEININFDNINFEISKKLSLPLLDGKTYVAAQKEAEGFVRLGPDEFSWRGIIADDNGLNGDVILTVKGRAMSGLIYTQAGVYEIVPQASFRHLLVQINQSLFPPCGGALPAPENQNVTEQHGTSADESKLVAANVEAAPDDGSLIDVLVVYTAQARTALGGTTQTQAFIQQAISSTNATYQNSAINPRLRLVGTLEVSYDEAAGTLDAALDWVRTDSAVAAARNNVKADLVSIITENGGGNCGLGYLQRTVGPGFAGSAFSAVARSCAVGNLSFAHELGHNEGCEHNPENGGSPTEAAYPYAFGHYVNGSFRTVMSYTDPCPSGCNRIAYFSNPAINFNGLPTGIANERDNHRVINNTALTVSLFRNSGGATPTPTPTPTPGQANLLPYQPTGWSDKIVVSKAAGTNIDNSPLTSADTLYIDWAIVNRGTAATGVIFYTSLLVDGVERASWISDPPLNINFYTYIQDYSIGKLSTGTHTIKIIVDATNTIPESNESDNEYTKTITVERPPAAVGFNASSYTVGEAAGSVAVVVNRTDTSASATVDYATSDTSGLAACNQVTGGASSRCDYASTVGTLRFAAGEGSKTISIPLVDDGYVEGPESLTIKLSNPGGTTLGATSTATIMITDNDTATSNPIAGAPFFIRQQYIDFLGREPDPAGMTGWQNILNSCRAGDTSCDRIAVSSGFFRSPEFQLRGYFIYKFYSAALGRTPRYSEFVPDLAKVSGFLTDAQLEANKVAFVQEFMTRAEYVSRYGALTNDAAYVDALLQTGGLPNHPLRQPWIDVLNNGTATRAQVLRAFTESVETYNKYYNEAFVVMQYFGYLRRDPDAAYLQWVQTMNQNGGDFRTMISGFMNSNEYVLRFGP